MIIFGRHVLDLHWFYPNYYIYLFISFKFIFNFFIISLFFIFDLPQFLNFVVSGSAE
jgi:hypothetical protein